METAYIELIQQAQTLLERGQIQIELLERAMMTSAAYVETQYVDAQGQTQTIKLPSLVAINNALVEYKTTVGSLVDGNYLELLNINDELKRIYLLNFGNQTKRVLQSTTNVENGYVDAANDILTDLMSENVSYVLNIGAQDNVSAAYYTKLKIPATVDISVYKNKSYADVTAALTAESIAYTAINGKANVLPSVPRYYGDFVILSVVERIDDLTSICHMSSLLYNDSLNPLYNSMQLTVGTKLTNAQSNAIFEVTAVDTVNMYATLKVVDGFSAFIQGSGLTLLNTNADTRLAIPIKYKEHSLLFVQTLHRHYNTLSTLGTAFELISANVSITVDNAVVNVDEYFERKNVQDIGAKLKSFAELLPPIDPVTVPAPAITDTMFSVVLINSHLLETKSITKLKSLNASKTKLTSKISKTLSELNAAKLQLDNKSYVTNDEKLNLEAQITKLGKQANIDTIELSAIKESFDSNTVLDTVSKFTPKYKVRGMWPEPDATNTIVQYIVEYRYLSVAGDISKPTQHKATSKSTGVFSAWNRIESPKREKLPDGSYAVNDITNSEQININQVEITINESEWVELRIKAVSEVGQPIATYSSDWSETILIKFPQGLKDAQDIKDLVQNVNDNKKVEEINQVLSSLGITNHIQDSATVNGQYIAHYASKIAYVKNGQVITMQDLLDAELFKLTQAYNTLFSIRNRIKIRLVDEAGEYYSLNKNAVTEIFAGYYLTSNVSPGDIIQKKFYIEILSESLDSAYMYSPAPGNSASLVDILYQPKYANAPIGTYINTDPEYALPFGGVQMLNQIVYARNRNFANNFDIYDTTSLFNNSSYMADGSAVGTTYVQVNALNAVESISLTTPSSASNASIVMTSSHPLAAAWLANPSVANANAVKAEFDIIKALHPTILQTDYVQQSFNTVVDSVKVLFKDNDKYLVGPRTCGMFATLTASSMSDIQIAQNDPSVGIDVMQGSSNYIRIPITVQYRMADSRGSINGSWSVLTDNPTYKKTIGFDLLMFGELMQFDITFTSKYKATSL